MAILLDFITTKFAIFLKNTHGIKSPEVVERSDFENETGPYFQY